MHKYSKIGSCDRREYFCIYRELQPITRKVLLHLLALYVKYMQMQKTCIVYQPKNKCISCEIDTSLVFCNCYYLFKMVFRISPIRRKITIIIICLYVQLQFQELDFQKCYFQNFWKMCVWIIQTLLIFFSFLHFFKNYTFEIKGEGRQDFPIAI